MNLSPHTRTLNIPVVSRQILLSEGSSYSTTFNICRTVLFMSEHTQSIFEQLYRASHVLVDWVLLTWISSVPLSARLCLGWWDFGRSGWVAGQDGGTKKSKSIQPRSTRTWNALLIGKISVCSPPWVGKRAVKCPSEPASLSRPMNHEIMRAREGSQTRSVWRRGFNLIGKLEVNFHILIRGF